MRSLIRMSVVAAACLVSGQFALAQGLGRYQGQKPGAVQMFSNPGMNPYMNPYAAGMMPNNPDFLLYMNSANQMNGGFGTGVMSGTRAAPGQQLGTNGQALGTTIKTPGQAPMGRNTPAKAGQAKAKNGRPAALMPLASSVPGSGAAGFFGRGFDSTGGAGRFYNRTSGRFQNNGR